MKNYIKNVLSVCICLLLFCFSFNALAISSQTSTENPFTFSHLVDNSNHDNLIITIFDEISTPITITLTTGQGGKSQKTISLEDSNMIEFTNLKINESYKICIEADTTYRGEIKLLSGTTTVQTNVQDVNGNYINQIQSRISGGTYQAKSASGNIGSATTSMWKAIEIARNSGIGTAYVELTRYGTTSTVWQKSNTTRYYRYQFDGYYGYVSTVSDALAWINAYNYSHIIDQNGTPTYDYYQKLKGNSTEYIERNVGAYYYNFSGSNNYKKATTIVDLSGATFKTSTSSFWNGYMFLGFKHPSAGVTMEGGLRFEGTTGQTTIHPYVFYYDTNLQKRFIAYDSVSDIMTTATTNSDGSISFNDKIKLTLCLVGNNTLRLEVYNLTTGKFRQYTISDALISATSPTRWLSCVSFVPVKEFAELNDLRSGAYMRNVKLEDTSLYTAVTSTTAISFNPSTAESTWAFVYNTDCIDYSRSNTTETINIFYDRQ